MISVPRKDRYSRLRAQNRALAHRAVDAGALRLLAGSGDVPGVALCLGELSDCGFAHHGSDLSGEMVRFKDRSRRGGYYHVCLLCVDPFARGVRELFRSDADRAWALCVGTALPFDVCATVGRRLLDLRSRP